MDTGLEQVKLLLRKAHRNVLQDVVGNDGRRRGCLPLASREETGGMPARRDTAEHSKEELRLIMVVEVHESGEENPKRDDIRVRTHDDHWELSGSRRGRKNWDTSTVDCEYAVVHKKHRPIAQPVREHDGAIGLRRMISAFMGYRRWKVIHGGDRPFLADKRTEKGWRAGDDAVTDVVWDVGHVSGRQERVVDLGEVGTNDLNSYVSIRMCLVGHVTYVLFSGDIDGGR